MCGHAPSQMARYRIASDDKSIVASDLTTHIDRCQGEAQYYVTSLSEVYTWYVLGATGEAERARERLQGLQLRGVRNVLKIWWDMGTW
jgi:hypothetical protein